MLRVLERRVHEFTEDGNGELGRAVADRLVRAGAAGPDGGAQLRCVAHEPDIGGPVVAIGRRAGLSCHGLVDGKAGAGAGTALDDRLEHVGHGFGLAGREHLGGVVLVRVELGAVAREYLGDGHGIAMVAAVREGCVRLGHLERGEVAGAEGQVVLAAELRRLVFGVDAQVGRHGLQRVVTDGSLHLHVCRVGGDGRGARQGAHAVVVVAGVLDRDGPAAIGLDGHGRGAVQRHAGVHAGLDGCRERDALEGGAHGATRERMVRVRPRGVVVVAPAVHDLDVSGLGIDRDRAAIEFVGPLGGIGLVDRLLRRGLHGGVDGGLHREPALEDHVCGELLLQDGLHVVHEVGIGERAVLGRLGHVQDDVLGLRGVVLLLGDAAVAKHAVEHDVAALLGKIGVHRGVVGARSVGNAHQERGLRQGEVGAVLAEVGVRRRLDAVGAVSVVDGVEVHLEDVVLGEDLLHLDGDPGLADLAFDGLVELLLGEDGVAHELLRDG